MTDEQILELSRPYIGADQGDSEILLFARALLSASKPAAPAQSPSTEAVEEQMTYEQRLVVAIRQWAAKQKPLDAASAKVLYDNLWDMYVDDAAAQTARGASEENP